MNENLFGFELVYYLPDIYFHIKLLMSLDPFLWMSETEKKTFYAVGHTLHYRQCGKKITQFSSKRDIGID